VACQQRIMIEGDHFYIDLDPAVQTAGQERHEGLKACAGRPY